jgi:hypothetical protein
MKAKFSGHDTFPLRYGWLYKAVNHMNSGHFLKTSKNEDVEKAVIELGVGKNMVNAIRYWSDCTGVIFDKVNKDTYVTELGNYIFGDFDTHQGKDPYLEQKGSIWLIHFLLNFDEEYLTSYRYFFNFSYVQSFEKEKYLFDFVEDTQRICQNDGITDKSLKKDLDCFLHSYCRKRKANSSKTIKIDEDHFSSPLAELSLINDNGNGFYTSPLREQQDLPIEIFIYAVARFMSLTIDLEDVNVETEELTIGFDTLLSNPFSPGRIFRLSEHGLGLKLDDAQLSTDGGLTWVDSRGLRQISCPINLIKNPIKILNKYYGVE